VDSSDKTVQKAFGRQIYRLRQRLGISQEELGFKAGVHRNYIGLIERGVRSPTLNVILKLAKAVHKPASGLVASVEKNLD
jgi:transcriptional regulator with XRE-family HTH domain